MCVILKSQCFVPGVSDFACSSTSTSRKVFRTLDRLNMLHLLGRHLLGRHHYDSTMFLESLTRKDVHSYVKPWQDLVTICKGMLPQSQCLTFSQVSSSYFRLLQVHLSRFFNVMFVVPGPRFYPCPAAFPAEICISSPPLQAPSAWSIKLKGTGNLVPFRCPPGTGTARTLWDALLRTHRIPSDFNDFNIDIVQKYSTILTVADQKANMC